MLTPFTLEHGRSDMMQKQDPLHDKLSNHLIGWSITLVLRQQVPSILLALELYPFVEFMTQNGFSMDHSQKHLVQVLPNMSLRALRLKISKTFKSNIRQSKISCWLRMRDGSLSVLDTRDDSRPLDWLGIENGSQIIYKIIQ
jgi:hypothetical protein